MPTLCVVALIVARSWLLCVSTLRRTCLRQSIRPALHILVQGAPSVSIRNVTLSCRSGLGGLLCLQVSLRRAKQRATISES